MSTVHGVSTVHDVLTVHDVDGSMVCQLSMVLMNPWCVNCP